MSLRHCTTTASRLLAALLLAGAAGAAGVVGAASAGAAIVPAPSPTAGPSPLEGAGLGEAVNQVQGTVQGAVSGLVAARPGAPSAPAGAAPTAAPPSSSRGEASGGPAPRSHAPARAQTSTQAKAPAQAPAPAPAPAAAEASSPGSVRASSSAGSVCLIPTGGASPAFEVGLHIGQDLLSPLVAQFPQAFAPCPKDAVRADGDTLAAADATVRGLLGACVRVTRQVVPLQTTLVVLDHDLVRELTAAGVPLDQLVVPCPATTAVGGPGGTDESGGTGGSATTTAGDRVAGAVSDGTASALITRLAFTGSEPGPVLFAAVALLCAGVLLVRKARLLTAAARG